MRAFIAPKLAAACFTALALSLSSGQSHAQNFDNPPQIETSKTFGDYEVLYTVVPTTTLLPQVAAQYHIVRADDQALVNISVRRHLPDGSDMAQPVAIKGTYSDLIQAKNLEFREVAETGAVYYLAQLRFSNRETLRFDVKVTPLLKEGETAPIGTPFAVTFTRKFFIDK